MTYSLGFVGLGSMGGPMCRRLTRSGYTVHAFDLDPTKLAVAVEAGALPVGSAAAAAAYADILATSP
jgi:3-hydroxyisobutyrate dehydrogenase